MSTTVHVCTVFNVAVVVLVVTVVVTVAVCVAVLVITLTKGGHMRFIDSHLARDIKMGENKASDKMTQRRRLSNEDTISPSKNVVI